MKIKYIIIGATLCFLILLGVLIFPNTIKKSNPANNILSEYDSENFITSYMGISKSNGLFYSKIKSGEFDIYNTAYANQILKDLDTSFSQNTYLNIKNCQQEDGSFVFSNCETDIIKSTYLACLALGKKAIENPQIIDKILGYQQSDGHFMPLQKNQSDNFQKKAEYTYMAVYILAQAGIESEKLEATLNWSKQHIENLHDSNDILSGVYLIRIRKQLDTKYNTKSDTFNNGDIQKVLEINYKSKKIDSKAIYKIGALSSLSKEGAVEITPQMKTEILPYLLDFIDYDIGDWRMLYEIVHSYYLLGGDMNDIRLRKLEIAIKGSELTEGGIGNTQYVGTPRETMMVFSLEKDAYKDDKKSFIQISKDMLYKELSSKESYWDNADIYSLLALHKIQDTKIENKDMIIKRMTGMLGCELVSQNWREWYYAIKSLELIAYDFQNEDLPLNYRNLIENLKNTGSFEIVSNADENNMLLALIIDGLLTIKKDKEDQSLFAKHLTKMSNTNIKDILYLKKRYYATIALYKLGVEASNIEETLALAKDLKYKDGYKATEESVDSDIQSTFQMHNLIKIQMGVKENEIYR